MREETDQRPPFGGSWGWWYAAVLVHLALLITLFALLTRIYASR